MKNLLQRAGWISLALLLLGMSSTTLHAQYLKEVWQLNDLGYNIGSKGFYSVDLNGDGTEEVLFSSQIQISDHYSYEYGERFFVLSYTENDYQVTYSSPTLAGDPYGGGQDLNWITIANNDGDEDSEIYVLSNEGIIQVYDGSTRAPIDTLTLESVSNPSKMEYVDVDNDGLGEFVVLNAASYNNTWIKVFDAVTLDLEREVNGAFVNFSIGDVDGDGSNEIVTSDGMVLDGATHELQWKYAEGFGGMLQLFQADDDPALEILAYNNRRLIAFDGEFETPLWEIESNYLTSMTAADYDEDGDWEIFLGNDYNGRLDVYQASTQELTKSIENTPRSPVSMVVGDPDADGQNELILGSGDYYYSSGLAQVVIVDIAAGRIEYNNASLAGPFLAQTGHIDQEKGPEIVVAARNRSNGYDGGIVVAYGGDQHDVRWSSSGSQDFSLYDAFESLGVADINDDGDAEIFVSQYNQTLALDGWPPELLWRDNNLESLRIFAAGDVDRDGDGDLVVGGEDGRISILDGETSHAAWTSITTNGQIGGVRLANLDEDEALEIAFFNQDDRVHVYDGVTHFLEWQSMDIVDASALDVGDLDRDGQNELVVGHQNGQVTILEAGSFSTVEQFTASEEAITGLRVGNVDDTEVPELLIASGSLKVLNWPEKDTLWQSHEYGGSLGRQDGLHIVDLDEDGYMDVLVAGLLGIVQLESAVRYPDVTAPVFRDATPASGASLVSRDHPVHIRLSEPVDAAGFETHVRIRTDDADVGFTVATDGPSIALLPVDLWPAASEIEVTLLGTLADSAGNGIDGNRNGISDGSPDDDLTFSFFTGTGIDSIGPVITNIEVELDSIWVGTRLRVSGLITDTSSVAASVVAAAEFFVDEAGEPGTGISIPAADSLYDEVEEEIAFAIDTDGLEGGEHTAWVRALDSRGNWGELMPIPFYLISSEGSEWAQFGQNAQHTGFNARDAILPPLQLDWNTDPIEGALTASIVVGDLVYLSVASYFGDNQLLALDEATGDEVWSHSFGSISGMTMPAFAYGRVYVQSINHTQGSYVTAFDALTGRQEWQSPFGSHWSGGIAPTVADGKVFVNAGYYGGMTAYDAFSGEELWFIDLPQEFGWAPTYYHGMVYSAWDNSSYYAIDAEDGELKYRHGSPNHYGYTAVIKDSVLYTTNPLAAIELGSREVRWSKSSSTTPALAYGKVFAVAFGDLKVYDEFSGATLWTYSPESDELSFLPVIANNYVFVSSETHTYALGVDSGNEIWSHGVGGPLAIANDRLFVSGTDGSLYVFKQLEDTGTLAEDEGLFPREYDLEPNYPNPFGVSTAIAFEIPSAGPVRLEVYNTLGQLVATLVDEHKAPGRYEEIWDPGSLSSGQYFYRITAGEFTAVRPMALIR